MAGVPSTGGAGGVAGVPSPGGAGGQGGAPPVPCSGAGEFSDPATQHCYRFVATPLLDWPSARTDCQSWGGDLAALTSLAELTLVLPHLQDGTWIGASDAAVEGTWVWVTGEPWGYTAWETNEPNASGDCLWFWHATLTGWDDTDCATPHAYLCERPGP